MQDRVEQIAKAEPAPQFLLEWNKPSPKQVGTIAAWSLGAHILLLAAVLLAPSGRSSRSPEITQLTVGEARRQSTPLIAPPSLLTQRGPNRGPAPKEITLSDLAPRPNQVQMPNRGAAAAPKQPLRQAQLPQPRNNPAINPAAQNILLPDAPNLQTAQAPVAPPAFGTNTSLPPAPQIAAAEEKPRLTFERPGSPTAQTGVGRIPLPKNSIEEAVKEAARGAGGGLIVGDLDSGGGNPLSPPVPVPGKMGSSLQLLSDPGGVDFSSYLMRVLSSVRRNWFAVIPESAKLGRVGRTVVRFTITREGKVQSVDISMPSGTEALDRAAMAGISASNPFPPLPPEYKAGQVRLQLVFKYNIK